MLGVRSQQRRRQMERKRARDWYWWLWLSPLLTIPTLAFFFSQHVGTTLVCGAAWHRNWQGCDWATADRVTILIAVLVSALWHLVLLGGIRNKEYPFVRWHGRQALLLAGVRTLVPLAFGLAFGEEAGTLLFIPVQLVVWFGGTLWGQRQAARGKCSLARWFGQEELLASIEEQDAEALIEIVRFSRDPAERDKAVEELTKRGMVEDL
jgi:hypothetical protein